MRYKLFILALLYSISGSSQAPGQFVGSWKGKLNVGVEVTLVFHINALPAGGYISTADSPDQGAFGLECDTTIVNGRTIKIEMKRLGASFTGKLVNDTIIEGTFTQGVDIELVLKKEGKSPESTGKWTEKPAGGKEIEVGAENAILSGTLLAPAGPKNVPVVLLIAGSGPTDRDGNTPLIPGKNNSLRLVAEELGANGIATLRYDKRGIGKTRIFEEIGEDKLTIQNFVDDAEVLYNWLIKEGFTKIYIAGHSEGSLIGMLLAKKVKPAGFISIAGAGRKATEILKEQLSQQVTPDQLNEFSNAADSIAAGHTVKTINPIFHSLLRPAMHPYLRSWFSVDPAKLMRELKCPVLIIQGGRDIQVSVKDGDSLASNSKTGDVYVLIEPMNHVLKEVYSDDRSENIKTYSDPSLPLADGLMRDMVKFIRENK